MHVFINAAGMTSVPWCNLPRLGCSSTECQPLWRWSLASVLTLGRNEETAVMKHDIKLNRNPIIRNLWSKGDVWWCSRSWHPEMFSFLMLFWSQEETTETLWCHKISWHHGAVNVHENQMMLKGKADPGAESLCYWSLFQSPRFSRSKTLDSLRYRLIKLTYYFHFFSIRGKAAPLWLNHTSAELTEVHFKH